MNPPLPEAPPQPPSRVSTWLWRAALLLPLGLGGLKLADLRDETLSTTATLLTVFCVASLVLGSVQVWRIAGRPRLTWTWANSLQHRLPRPERQVIYRALHRHGPLPPGLRPAAARRLWGSRNQIPVWGTLALGGANLVPNRSMLERPTWLAACAVLIGLVLATALAAVTVHDRRLRRRAHELGLPLEPHPAGGDPLADS